MNSDIDLHIHTTASDGTDQPLELIERIKNAHIHIFSITDHDTIQGVMQVKDQIPKDLTFIKGIEFSTITPIRQAHILGYDYDENNALFQAIIKEGNILRKNKMLQRLDYLKDIHHIIFNNYELNYLYSLNSVAKPHLASLIVKKGYASTISEAIEKYINGIPGETERIDAKAAIEAIKESGGIAIWAHPLGGENVKRLSEEDFMKQFHYLLNAGIQGLEVYYSRYDDNEQKYLSDLALKYHLLISGGSDYHGQTKNIELGTLNKNHHFIDTENLSLLKLLKKRNKKLVK
ncbi:hypothetical protein B7939_05250 [Eggerthia catenaformis]|nr:hypothetical protein B7939_05250 [Eggerthia catenaformis]